MYQTAFLGFLPIVFLIVLMTKRNSVPSFRALPYTALLVYVILMGILNRSPETVHATVLQGFLTSWTPILIIWGAIFLFRTMEECGAMNTVRIWLNGITPNKTGQLMIVGWAFPFLIEGASGFGTPAALAAPVLVGLGFPPLRIAVMTLLMNTVPVSFGAVGTPTWFGFGGLSLTPEQIITVGVKSAMIHSVAALFIPLIALSFVIERHQIKRNIFFIYLSIFSTIIPFLILSFFTYEFPALVGGAIGLVSTVLIAHKGIGLTHTETPCHHSEKSSPTIGTFSLLKAFFPLWCTILILILTRLKQLPFKSMLTNTQNLFSFELGSFGVFECSQAFAISLKSIFHTNLSWSLKLLYVPSLVPFILVSLCSFLLFKMDKKGMLKVWTGAFHQMKNPAKALFGALIFVNLMMMGEESSLVTALGQAMAEFTGEHWTSFAPFLGALGSFFSGSATISNLTFGGIQKTIALTLNVDITTILALQSVGGAMGNMVCINNIVAVCSVLALENSEGVILKKTALVLVAYGLIAAAVAHMFF